MAEDQPASTKYIAEFLGTFVLVFTIGCNVMSGQPVWGGVSIACALTVMIYALAPVSGANFNPAVSIALGLHGAMKWDQVGIYIAVQLVAGVVAGLSYLALFVHAFNLEPTPGHTIWQAGLAETLYTFMLVFVVLNVAVGSKNQPNEYFGLAIGFVIVAGAYGAGGISMGCFNPAVALGIDVASIFEGFGYCITYGFFEVIGAIMATGLFWVVRPEDSGDRLNVDPATSKLVSEFIGTFVLVLTVGLNVLGGSTAGAFSIAASLMCMIYALGSVSGAHFNPAVTVAIMASGRGKCNSSEGAKYMCAQIAGGVCAAFTYSAMKGGKSFALKPESSTWIQIAFAEFAFTFVLAFVVLSVATVRKSLNHYFGFAIGMCVTVGGCAIGKISGGSLNPAVSIGISASHAAGHSGFGQCIIYSVIELMAGAAAAGAFSITQPSEYDTEEERKPLAHHDDNLKA